MLSPQELYEFLSLLSMQAVEHGDLDLASDLQRAMKHFVSPLTSEFFGVSMAALKTMLTSNQNVLSNEDKTLANIFVKEIEEKWFRQSS